jgi:DNA repair exonuclease SbcCD ATPase subunit
MIALVMQAAWRALRARREHSDRVSAAIRLQCAWRCQVAATELRSLRKSARESTKLLEDKKALESRVQELAATLAVVQDQRNELRAAVSGGLMQVSGIQMRNWLETDPLATDSLGPGHLDLDCVTLLLCDLGQMLPTARYAFFWPQSKAEKAAVVELEARLMAVESEKAALVASLAAAVAADELTAERDAKIKVEQVGWIG